MKFAPYSTRWTNLPMSHFAPTWSLWLSRNWPLILAWNELRGTVHVLQVWGTVGPTFGLS